MSITTVTHVGTTLNALSIFQFTVPLSAFVHCNDKTVQTPKILPPFILYRFPHLKDFPAISGYAGSSCGKALLTDDGCWSIHQGQLRQISGKGKRAFNTYFVFFWLPCPPNFQHQIYLDALQHQSLALGYPTTYT